MRKIAKSALRWPDAAVRRLLSTEPVVHDPEVESIVLCAGVGARMAPLSDATPKPLLPVLNCPLALWNLALMARITHLASLNLHYLSSSFEPLPVAAKRHGLSVRLVIEDTLSGPFGGVLSCYRDRPAPRDIFVVAGDGVYDADVAALLDNHRRRDADLSIGTAPVADGSRYGVLQLDHAQRVISMREKPPDVGPASVSCGVYIVSCRVVDLFRGDNRILDWVDVVSTLLREKRLVLAAPVARWLDAGAPEDLLAANLKILNSDWITRVAERASEHRASVWRQDDRTDLSVGTYQERVLIGADAIIDAGARLSNCVIGTGAHIGSGAVVRDAVIMPGATAPPHSHISHVMWTQCV